MDKNVTSLTIFMEKGGNPIKVCNITGKKEEICLGSFHQGYYGILQIRVMQIIQLLLCAVIVNYVNAIVNIHSLIIPQGYYYINIAKINGPNSDT